MRTLRHVVVTLLAVLTCPAMAAEPLPDGGIAKAASGDVRAARYILPTTRYAHGVLGDAVEAGGLEAVLSDGKSVAVTLPDDLVFEDITPRLADLDGDGTAEIITILASLTQGAALSVFALKDGQLREVARAPFVGRPNRWLNIAAIADFTGDDRPEIAIVKTPHLGGALEFWSPGATGLRLVGSLPGFSNHEIGSRALGLSAVFRDQGRTVLLVPAAGRTALRAVAFVDGKPAILSETALPAPAVGDFRPANNRFDVPLADGRVFPWAYRVSK